MFFRKKPTKSEQYLKNNKFKPKKYEGVGKKEKPIFLVRLLRWVCGYDKEVVRPLPKNKEKRRSVYLYNNDACRDCGESTLIPKNQIDFRSNRCITCNLEFWIRQRRIRRTT